MMKIGKTCLLHTASVDAMGRLRSRSAKFDEVAIKQLFTIYFDQQEHFSLTKFLGKQVKEGYPIGGLLIQVLVELYVSNTITELFQITTYGPLLTQTYKKDSSSLLAIEQKDIHMCQLPEFDTEMDFVGEIRCVIMNPLGNNGVSFYVMMIFFFS